MSSVEISAVSKLLVSCENYQILSPKPFYGPFGTHCENLGNRIRATATDTNLINMHQCQGSGFSGSILSSIVSSWTHVDIGLARPLHSCKERIHTLECPVISSILFH